MNRLKDAKHYAGESNTVSNQCTERNIGYNRNSCISGLDRYGAEGLSESVIFGHTGNRLSSLSSWNGAGLLENGYFTYDAMGNMLTDSRKGLEFSYNLANLPESVEGADGASLTYSYLPFGARYYDPFTCRWTTRDPMAGKYLSLSPYAYCCNDPVRFVDTDGRDKKDYKRGLQIGTITNSIPFSGFLRDSYTPTDIDDYNAGLRQADEKAALSGEIAREAGKAATEGGLALTAVGGASMISIAGVPGGIVVATGGISVSVAGLAAIGAGSVLMLNASHNSSKGYERGGSKSNNQMNKEIKKGKAPDTIKRVDNGNIKNEKPHVHFSDGSALNKDGTWKHQPNKGKEHNITNKEKQFLQEYDWTIPE